MAHHEIRRSDDPGWLRPVGAAPAAATGASSRARRYYRWSLVLGFVLLPAPVLAVLTISFVSVSGSVPLTGAGTSVATVNFGSVSAFEPLNTGVTRTRGASSYTVSTSFGVRSTQLPALSPNYTLRARLLTAQPLTWQIDGVTMSTSQVTIATLQPYGTAVPHTLAFVVPFSAPAGLVDTVLEITAIAN